MRLPWPSREKRFQVVDRGYEVTLLHRYRKIDGVEVDSATEAAAEIRIWVHRRMALPAAGTQECELSLADLVRPLQLLQERNPHDLVA